MSEDRSPIEFEIYMTDVTLNESDGVFDVANSIMNKHSCNAKRNEWFIRSNIGVLNNFGYNEFVCQFDNNKNVFIVSYSPVIRDTFYNVDIRCFSQWCMQKGWNQPEPSSSVIEERIDFWKYQWETGMIYSSYFDNIFGNNQED